MEWGVPKNLLVLWAVPLLALVYVWSSARKRAAFARFGDPALVARLVESLDHRRRLLKRALFTAAMLLIALALAQPHWRKKETKVETKGVDAFISIDVSRSMLAKDIPPTRLDKAKLELTNLIGRLPSDRIGIVAFAGEAVIQCPLTLDRGAAKLFLSTVAPGLVDFQGTSLTKAIQTAVNGFPKGEKDSRAIILLTDGEDQEPGAPAAAKKALEAGVRVYVIGIGTPDGSVLPSEDGRGYKKDRTGQVVLSKLNENLLRDVARAGGGTYWRAARGELEAERLVGELRRLSQKSQGSGWAIEYEESFQIFLLFAWLLLAAEFAVPEAKRK